MTETMKDLWNGNIAPCEGCGSHDPVILELFRLLERNRESLRKELTDVQMETFQKYLDCSEEYLFRMLELSFCDGFRLGSKLIMEVFL